MFIGTLYIPLGKSTGILTCDTSHIEGLYATATNSLLIADVPVGHHLLVKVLLVEAIGERKGS